MMSEQPGPFEFRLSENSREIEESCAVANGVTSLPLALDNQPERRFDCPHYETCLGLAAALNWDSFTCCHCTGDVNQQLLWRAHQSTKKDSDLADLCKLPGLHLFQRSCQGTK